MSQYLGVNPWGVMNGLRLAERGGQGRGRGCRRRGVRLVVVGRRRETFRQGAGRVSAGGEGTF